jgi:hypothetical protein
MRQVSDYALLHEVGKYDHGAFSITTDRDVYAVRVNDPTTPSGSFKLSSQEFTPSGFIHPSGLFTTYANMKTFFHMQYDIIQQQVNNVLLKAVLVSESSDKTPILNSYLLKIGNELKVA